ncbi:hypothetical protein LEP1GSC058_0311 [Leptospira fainei serovar Hurstbridge str. BUT 6]|uniref:Uncharacterized protein n=1 Tax=Leptospira fainei serovar Hurstbridge str. BUT 6 TaxID=1193011 RepID=S3UZD8_9LEPT|nr:hypothetical protein LEP1GSC058_0311 [Leptospira fainei serovar Hurstbridge str. BUT 6]
MKLLSCISRISIYPSIFKHIRFSKRYRSFNRLIQTTTIELFGDRFHSISFG